MADTTTDTRARAGGSAADRKTSLAVSGSIGGAAALVVGASDWLILSCYQNGHFHYVPPPKTLVEMGAMILVFPVAHFVGRCATLIARKILKSLGDNGEET